MIDKILSFIFSKFKEKFFQKEIKLITKHIKEVESHAECKDFLYRLGSYHARYAINNDRARVPSNLLGWDLVRAEEALGITGLKNTRKIKDEGRRIISRLKKTRYCEKALKKARRNDHRDERGRFTKAPK